MSQCAECGGRIEAYDGFMVCTKCGLTQPEPVSTEESALLIKKEARRRAFWRRNERQYYRIQRAARSLSLPDSVVMSAAGLLYDYRPRGHAADSCGAALLVALRQEGRFRPLRQICRATRTTRSGLFKGLAALSGKGLQIPQLGYAAYVGGISAQLGLSPEQTQALRRTVLGLRNKMWPGTETSRAAAVAAAAYALGMTSAVRSARVSGATSKRIIGTAKKLRKIGIL